MTIRGSTICDSCAGTWYWRCSTCDGWNRDGDRCGNGCCSEGCDCDGDCDCCSADTSFEGLAYDYFYKPTPIFHGSGPLFLGPEIEVATPNYCRQECAEIAVAHLESLGYLKLDSSVGNGFEIVTHPMSYEWAIANFPWRLLTRLRDHGCEVTDNTGIHVHLSRAGFRSASHVYQWMKFIYRNEKAVTTIARRSSTMWAAFTDDDRRAVKQYAKGARSDRHRAINTSNDDTFELRIFASSLDPGDVKAALAFAAASAEYTRELTADKVLNGGGWTWPTFVAWLAEHPVYEPLTQQLKDLQCVY